MELSKRLKAVADLISGGEVLADVGTDHAYIPIFLVGNGSIPSAIAMDVNIGPLERARENIREAGMDRKISTRLSDGFLALEPGEAGCAVTAGMGGALMIRILREGARTVQELKECILQPQSEIEKVRAFLIEEGFSFIREDMVEEDGKFYPVIKVKPGISADGCGTESGEQNYSRTELRYGRLLLRERHLVLKKYLEHEIRLYKDIIRRLENNDSSRARERLQEVARDLECAEKGMGYYAM